MKLYIDTSSNLQTIVRVGDKELKSGPKKLHSQIVLPMIKKLCPDLTKITEIEVNPGPGSYTGLRVGASIAKVLGFVLNVPVIGAEPVYD